MIVVLLLLFFIICHGVMRPAIVRFVIIKLAPTMNFRPADVTFQAIVHLRLTQFIQRLGPQDSGILITQEQTTTAFTAGGEKL